MPSLDRSLIAVFPAFAGVSGGELDRVLASARSARRPKDSGVFSQGEEAGHAVAMGRSTYPATSVAAIDCVALDWPNSLWPDLQVRFPPFGASAHLTIGSRLQDTKARVMEMSTEQVEQRIAHTILSLVKQSGRKTESGIEIDFPITGQDIAEMTGTTLHTVSRHLSGWESDVLVRSGRQKVTVTDPHELMLVAENRRRK